MPTKRARSDAAKRGWETRRRREHERQAERARRSVAARKGWETRKEREAQRRKPPGIGRVRERVREPVLPVYAEDELERGAQLGWARTREAARDVAEDARPDDELEHVYTGAVPSSLSMYGEAWLARYRVTVPEDESDEWEIGFEYRGADRHSHVDVNIRIAREDGHTFGFKEAQRVLTQFRENLAHDANPIPAGYLMAFIDWKRPRKGTGWQHGGEHDLDSFHAPMYVESGNTAVWSIEPSGNVRLGSVKK